MPKPISDETIVQMDQYRAPRVPVSNDRIDWMEVPQIKDMIDLLASEDAEGMSDFLCLAPGEQVQLTVELTDPKIAQAVLHSIRCNESFIPGMAIKKIKLNPEKE